VRKNLSIVHVTRSPVGGIFRHISDLAFAQHMAGGAVGLICDSVSGGAFEEERIAALAPRLKLGIVRVPMSRSIGPADLAATLAVSRRIAVMRPDVVHAHGAKGGLYGRIAAMAERRRGRQVAAFYAPHGGSLHYDPRSLAGRLFFAVERALERVTDGLIHVSAYEAAAYREKIGAPRCPAHVVLNGLRPEEFEPVVAESDAADFLFIGELRDLKGVDVLIEALAILRREGRNPRALIVGGGTPVDERRYWESVVSAGLSGLVEFRPPMAARRAFALARTIVVPSRAESLPYLVLEAAAAGMPIIATRVGGIPEILGDLKPLVLPGDAPALAAAMRSALATPPGMPSHAHLRQKFSLDAMAARIAGIYREALERRYSSAHASASPEADFSR
jgi:glycosyltransferase involved in cell wall biosynthesis